MRCWLNSCIINPRFVSRAFLPDFSSHVSACMERPRREEEAGLREVSKRVRQGSVYVCVWRGGWGGVGGGGGEGRGGGGGEWGWRGGGVGGVVS